MFSMSLFSHSWKSSVRSIIWGRELGANIVIGAILALLALNLLGLGLFIRPVLEEMYPGEDPVVLVNGILLAWFMFDVMLRLFLQKAPSVEVLPYLLLPVPRRHIVRFMLLRTLISGFNIVPLFAIIPIVFTLMLPETGWLSSLAWFLGVSGMMVLANVIVFATEKLQAQKTRTVPLIALAMAALFVLGEAGIFELAELSAALYGSLLTMPLTVLVWLAVIGAITEGVVGWLTGLLRLESLLEAGRIDRGMSGDSLLKRFEGKGAVAAYLGLELKMLLRNKRPRASFGLVIFVILFVPLYYMGMAPVFLEFYPPPDHMPTREVLTAATLPEERLVQFVVRDAAVPKDAWVYVTGNHSLLGPWKPSKVPLVRNEDSSWSRTIPFVEGTALRVIVTLGTWRTEASTGPDLEPDVKEFTVTGDTTIVLSAPAWKQPALDGFETFMLLYMALLFVGMPMLVHGQFLFVWESNYFDLLLTAPVDCAAYLRAKLYLLLSLGFFGLLLGLPMFFIAEQLLPIHVATGIYALGVNSFLLILWSMLSRKRMDLGASIFSTQGKGSTNFLTILPTMIAPILLFILANTILTPAAGLYVLGGLGVLGLLGMTPLMRFVQRTFTSQKYLMRAGFRQS